MTRKQDLIAFSRLKPIDCYTLGHRSLLLEPDAMIARVITALLVFAPISLFAEEHKEIVRWGIFDFNPIPFQTNKHGEHRGPDLDVVREVFSRIPNYELQEHVMPVARAAKEFTLGRLDFLLLLRSPDINRVSNFSQTPLRWLHFKLAVLSNSNFDYHSMDSIKNKSIGMISGIPIQEPLYSALLNDHFELVDLRDYTNLLEMLERERLDAILGSVPTLKRTADNMGVDVKILTQTPGVLRGYYPAISRKSKLKDKENLLIEIDKVLKEMQSDGSYERIYGSYGIAPNEYWPNSAE